MNEIDLRRVDLNLLVVFDVLMEERSVTRAADRLGRTQSAISHALGRLREQLGDPLLVKSGMRMLPSPFAEHLVMEVRPILANMARRQDSCKNLPHRPQCYCGKAVQIGMASGFKSVG